MSLKFNGIYFQSENCCLVYVCLGLFSADSSSNRNQGKANVGVDAQKAKLLAEARSDDVEQRVRIDAGVGCGEFTLSL